MGLFPSLYSTAIIRLTSSSGVHSLHMMQATCKENRHERIFGVWPSREG